MPMVSFILFNNVSTLDFGVFLENYPGEWKLEAKLHDSFKYVCDCERRDHVTKLPTLSR